ncbi:MAG: cell division protein FtsA [Parabacteroides sp.]
MTTTYTDFIAAIDLGTSQIVGMVGTKNAGGVLSIIAYEKENSTNCIRRGCVYNIEETANKIKRIILKLENKLHGSRIGKVYVGIGGQSLRSMDHTVLKVLGNDGVVTDETIQSMYQECNNYHPDMLDVLAAVSPTYYLDGKPEANPVGIPCNRIEALYKLIVGRPSLQHYLRNSITERAKIEIAGIYVSPLAMADVLLSDDEKDLGCALIGFGAGVTTLTVYKSGKLVNLSVIPFGGNTITRDITSLHLVEAEAERIKQTFGSAVFNKEVDQTIQVNSADGMGLKEIKLADLNNIIEARLKEILANVHARLEATGLIGNLGAGIIITGGGADLKSLPEAIKSQFKMDVRYGTIRKGIINSSELSISAPQNAVVIGLMMQGTANCAIPPVQEKPKEPEPVPEQEPVKPLQEPVIEQPRRKTGNSKKKGGLTSLFDKLTNTFGKDLFDDEDEEKTEK